MLVSQEDRTWEKMEFESTRVPYVEHRPAPLSSGLPSPLGDAALKRRSCGRRLGNDSKVPVVE